MDDLQQVYTIVGIVVPIVVAFVGYLVRNDRRMTRLLKEVEESRKVHEDIEREVQHLHRGQVAQGREISEIRGELKRVNGKH